MCTNSSSQPCKLIITKCLANIVVIYKQSTSSESNKLFQLLKMMQRVFLISLVNKTNTTIIKTITLYQTWIMYQAMELERWLIVSLASFQDTITCPSHRILVEDDFPYIEGKLCPYECVLWVDKGPHNTQQKL